MAKAGTLDHPKTKRLARALKAPPYVALGLLEAVWDWVGSYSPTGFISLEDIEEMTADLRFKGNLAKVLVENGWLDEEKNGFYIHDWHEHAQDRVKLALKRSGKDFHKKRSFEPECRDKAPTESLHCRDNVGTTKPSQAIPNHTKPSQAQYDLLFEFLKNEEIETYVSWRKTVGLDATQKVITEVLKAAESCGPHAGEFLAWAMRDRKKPLRLPKPDWFFEQMASVAPARSESEDVGWAE